MAPVVPATEENIERAAELLRAGELVSFPTETVYGLGANASAAEAVRRVFAAKGRPADHPLIVHIENAAALSSWAEDVPDEAIALAERFWPGPLTMVLKRGEGVPLEVTGGQETVAVRVPGHPVAQQLLRFFGGGVAAPSANRFGRISPTSAQHAASELGDRVAMILDGGPSDVGLESTIVDLSGDPPRILRPGMLSRSELEAVLGREIGGQPLGAAPRVPGALERHYSPDSPVTVAGPGSIEAMSSGHEVSVIATRPAPPGFGGRWLRLPPDPRGYAHGLYAALRELDGLGFPIVVEEPPDGEAWEAVRDRLRRASSGKGQRAAAEEEAR